jgi:carbon storage regulator
MLVLSRKIGESVVIDGRIVVTVVRVDGEAVRLGIQAPQDVPVHRQEVYEEIRRNNCEALTQQRRRVPRLVRNNAGMEEPARPHAATA